MSIKRRPRSIESSDSIDPDVIDGSELVQSFRIGCLLGGHQATGPEAFDRKGSRDRRMGHRFDDSFQIRHITAAYVADRSAPPCLAKASPHPVGSTRSSP